jgi:hypothetical protein
VGLETQSSPQALCLHHSAVHHSWWPVCQTANAKKTLSRLQILACLVTAAEKGTTATGAMEALTGLPPLDQVIQGEAKSAASSLGSGMLVLPSPQLRTKQHIAQASAVRSHI